MGVRELDINKCIQRLRFTRDGGITIEEWVLLSELSFFFSFKRKKKGITIGEWVLFSELLTFELIECVFLPIECVLLLIECVLIPIAGTPL